MKSRDEYFAGRNSKRSTCMLRLAGALLVVQFAAAPVMAKEKGFIGKFLDGFKGKEEIAEPVASNTGDSRSEASESLCPDDIDWSGLAPAFPEQCGLDRPPPSYNVEDRLDGVWDVYTPGDQPYAHMKIYVHMKGGILHRVNPNIPSPAMAVYRVKGGDPNQWSSGAIVLNVGDDGVLETALGGFGYCSCRSVQWRMKPTGNPNEMRGEWEFEGRQGSSVWRRHSTKATIKTVTISRAVADAEGNLVDDTFAYGSRRGRLERSHPVSCGYGQMRGNCERVWLTIRGDSFYGAHDVWLDPAYHIELGGARWLCSNGEYQNSNWHYCDPPGNPGNGVVGIQVVLYMRLGVKPGPMNLWVDGQPIPIDVVLAGYPEEEEERPALVSLSARDVEGGPITRIEEGKSFLLTATYDGDHPDPWTRVRAPNLPSMEFAGKLVEQEIVLQRTDNPKVFESGWITVKRSVVSPVADAPLGADETVQP